MAASISSPACAEVELLPGYTIILVSSGGGHGPPWQSNAERVAYDVRECWASPERVREVYWVEEVSGGGGGGCDHEREADGNGGGALMTR